MKILLWSIFLYLILSTITTYAYITNNFENKKDIMNYYFPWKLRKITNKVNIIGCTIYSLILIIISPIIFIILLFYLLITFKYPINKKIKYDKSLYFMKDNFDENSWKILCTSFEVPTSYNFIYCRIDANSVKEQQKYIEQYKNNKEKG